MNVNQDVPVINLTRINELKSINIASGSVLLKRLITSFQSSISSLKAQLETGTFYTMSLQEKESFFHKIAGLSANMGADRLSSCSKKLQLEAQQVSEEKFKEIVPVIIELIQETVTELEKLAQS
jgi:HPt (histidine-containing phosphotransfer) domain-containing protein